MADAPTNTQVVDTLSRAKSFVIAAHMAANALHVDQERDAMQEVLDAAEREIAEAQRRLQSKGALRGA